MKTINLSQIALKEIIIQPNLSQIVVLYDGKDNLDNLVFSKSFNIDRTTLPSAVQITLQNLLDKVQLKIEQKEL